MIVKIQRPLASSHPTEAPALIYNQDRSFEASVPLSAELLKIIGERPKIYAEIRRDADRLVVVRVVDPQPW